MADKKLEQRYPSDYWSNKEKADYMNTVGILLHNTDYLEFLVTRIWKLDQPCSVVDFGCGAGRSGRTLMPLLPEGSTYTGVDQSTTLLEEARRVFADLPYSAQFHEGDVHKVPFDDDAFDLAFSQVVLMHISDPMAAIREMMRVTRHGGMVIACDANRNAANALLQVDELDMQETVPLDVIQTVNREIRRRTGVDHNIGIKTPILMHKAGLKNVQARVSDCVRLVLPPIEGETEEAVFTAICEDGLGPPPLSREERVRQQRFMIDHGVSADTAADVLEWEASHHFRAKGRGYHTVYPSLLSFSFGTVEKRSSE